MKPESRSSSSLPTISATLRALVFGAALAGAPAAFADNLPEVQKLIKAGQFPQALAKVDAYLNSKPKDAQGRFFKGLILTEMNKPAEAIAVFTKLTEDYPELPEPYNNLAVLYAQQKQFDKARTALEMAIRTHPSYAIAYENLGDIYAKLASQAYDKALQLDSSNPTAQNKLALIRDLISPSGKPGTRPVMPATTVAAAPAPAPAPVVSKPAVVATPVAPAPSATVISATPATNPPPAAKPVATIATTPPTTVAAAAPAPAPAKVEAPKADAAADDVLKAVNGWAAAWSNKDVKAYLSHYAASFQPGGGVSRKTWEDQREDRIAGKPGKISVTIDNPQVTVNGDKATVRFRQHYRSSGLSTSTNKTLSLTQSGSKWLITDESTR